MTEGATKTDIRVIGGFIFAVIVGILGAQYPDILLGTMGIFLSVVLAVLFLLVLWLAGTVVFKALFFVAAEISFLIFLADAYCSSSRSVAADAALRSLVIIGLFVIALAFIRSLQKRIQKRYKIIRGEPWTREKIGIVTLFLLFVTMLVWQICLVLKPVIVGLCVF